MNEKLFSFLNWVTVIAVFVIAIYIIIFLKSESNKCMASPVQYGISVWEQNNNANITCTCTSDNIRVQNIIVTSKNITPVKSILGDPSSNNEYIPFNFSLWQINQKNP